MPRTLLPPHTPLPPQPKLSIVIPVFNENRTVDQLLTLVMNAPVPGWSVEVIAVDDGSTDGTDRVLKAWEQQWNSSRAVQRVSNDLDERSISDKEAHASRSFSLLLQPKNRGKGAALRSGFELATGDVVLIQDADLEYDPADYPALLQPLSEHRTRVVYGSRILHPDNHSYSALRFYLGGRLVTWFTNLLFGSRLTDEPTGYKVFRRDVLQRIPLECEGFEFCPEITAKLLRLKEPIWEVPIHYRPRKPDEGKKIGWLDGIEALQTLWRWRWKNF